VLQRPAAPRSGGGDGAARHRALLGHTLPELRRLARHVGVPRAHALTKAALCAAIVAVHARKH
jgi:hypothetical protein